MTATPSKCHAIASSPNGRIPGMHNLHVCRFTAKVLIYNAGVAYPICGVHQNAMRDTYRMSGGRHYGKVSFGIQVVADRHDRNAKAVRLSPHDEHAIEVIVAKDYVVATDGPVGRSYDAPKFCQDIARATRYTKAGAAARAKALVGWKAVRVGA